MTVEGCVPLIWEDAENWTGELERLAPVVCNPSIIERLLRNPPELITEDDLGWLGCLMPDHLRYTDDLRYEVFARLRSSFTHFSAYHGCRPLDLRSYQEAGITPLDTAAAHESLVRRACGVSASAPTEGQVRSACARANVTNEEGRVFFEANGRFLVDHCGHYLLYGSEYAVHILRSISDGSDYAQLLKLQGQPTLLKCYVPLDWLPEWAQAELASNLIARYFNMKLDPGYVDPRRDDAFGFAIFRTLPPELIVEISHPENIRDRIVPYP